MILNAIKIALKVLARRKFFTFISLFGTSFTLIVLVVVAALLDIFIRPGGPERNMPRMLGLYQCVMKSEGGNSTWSGSPGYRFLSRHVKTMQSPEKITIFSSHNTVSIYEGTDKYNIGLRHTDATYWEVLDFRFIEGVPFDAHHEQQASQVAVINQQTKERFFGSGSALGETIEIDGQTFEVIGVVENVPATNRSAYADVWVPIPTKKNRDYLDAMMGGFNALLLARSRSDFPAIKREYAAVLQQIDWPDPHGDFEMLGGVDTPLEVMARKFFNETEEGEVSTGVLTAVMSLAALIFMLLPSMNLTNINLSRIMERASEIGIRKSFGANSRHLVLQFVIENLVLTAIAGLIGFLGAYVILWSITQSDLFAYATFSPNFRVFAAGLLLILVFGTMSGVYPAWKMARMHPVYALKGGQS